MYSINLFGLALNFIGSLVIAFSVIENPAGGHQMIGNKKVYLASILSSRFKRGIFIFAVGFLMQFVSIICNQI